MSDNDDLATDEGPAMVDQMLREAHRVGAPSPEATVRQRARLDDLIAAETTGHRLEGRRGRRLGAFLIAGAVGVAAVAGGAAAVGVFARTGQHATGDESGSGEIIRIDADDAPEVIAGLGRDIPLPPGRSWDDVISHLPEDATNQAESSLRSMLEFNAACQWTTAWIEAREAGDRDAQAGALIGLERAARRPDLANDDEMGGVRQMWSAIADGARAGSPAQVNESGYTANCL